MAMTPVARSFAFLTALAAALAATSSCVRGAEKPIELTSRSGDVRLTILATARTEGELQPCD